MRFPKGFLNSKFLNDDVRLDFEGRCNRRFGTVELFSGVFLGWFGQFDSSTNLCGVHSKADLTVDPSNVRTAFHLRIKRAMGRALSRHL